MALRIGVLFTTQGRRYDRQGHVEGVQKVFHFKDLSDAAKKKSRAKKGKSRVNEAGNYTKPTMRKRLFNKIKAGSKGGKPGQWSARKAQMLAQQYKKAGGGYRD